MLDNGPLLAERPYLIGDPHHYPPCDGGRPFLRRSAMISHPITPLRLAILLDDGLPPEDYLQDMKESPDIYHPDHVAACHDQQVLPLSLKQWRYACRAS